MRPLKDPSVTHISILKHTPEIISLRRLESLFLDGWSHCWASRKAEHHVRESRGAKPFFHAQKHKIKNKTNNNNGETETRLPQFTSRADSQLTENLPWGSMPQCPMLQLYSRLRSKLQRWNSR